MERQRARSKMINYRETERETERETVRLHNVWLCIG